MNNKIFLIIILFLSYSCKNYTVEPLCIDPNYSIDTIDSKLIISMNSEHYITYKTFNNFFCHPRITYHSEYFYLKPFFVYRIIPMPPCNDVMFTDVYGKGIDSLNYEKLEIEFYFNGKQTVIHHSIYVLKECYAIGDEVSTEIVKRKHLARIAKEWNLIFTK